MYKLCKTKHFTFYYYLNVMKMAISGNLYFWLELFKNYKLFIAIVFTAYNVCQLYMRVHVHNLHMFWIPTYN